ncbi:hypothetical protein MMC11_005014 [Xylographa trunciseda]|nr:hypothetical protein [Xylographa trunciseda]
MLSSLLLSALFAAFVSSEAGFRLSSAKPKAFKDASPLTVSPHVVSFTKQKSSSVSQRYLRSIVARSEVNGVFGDAEVEPVEDGQVFLTNVTFGTQTFEAVIDTGSSDTWLVEKGFQCFNVTNGDSVPEAECAFGSDGYSPSSTFSQIPNENFNISYADGEMLIGIVGTEQVTLAGITVDNQEVGVVQLAGWFGDGISSGLIGLAFPSITSAYAGNDPSTDGPNTQLPYNPVFFNMFEEGNVAPLFSLAIDRGNATGQLAIGGIPDVSFSEPIAIAVFQVLTAIDESNSTTGQYQFYAIDAGFSFAGSDDIRYSEKSGLPVTRPANDTESVVIVDSGTTLLYAPTKVAYAVNAQFNPPAVFDESQGAFFVDCNATAPAFGVVIGGATFNINPLDLILYNGGGPCLSGIQDAGDSFGILGDVFLKNVLAVYDVGASAMIFAAREDY